MSASLKKGWIQQHADAFKDVVRYAVYTLFFLMPLFFLPWTTNVLEINKQVLLVILSIVALVAWLGASVAKKQLVFKKGWLNAVPMLFLGAVFLSSLTSLGGYQTWIGQASQEYVSFLTTAVFVLLFYVLVNTMNETKVQQKALCALLFSSAIAGLVTLFGLFDLAHLPFSFAQDTGFNTVGTINGFTIFMMTMMFLGSALWLVSGGKDKLIPSTGEGFIMRASIIFTSFMALLLMIVVDFWVFWVVAIAGVLLLCVFSFFKGAEFESPLRFVFPFIILLISVLFLFVGTPFSVDITMVVSPSYETSWDITKATLAEGGSQLFFGSGPGTFLYDYLEHKPLILNESVFWNIRFDQAKSFFLTQFAHLGLVGTLLWIVLMGWVATKALNRLVFERNHKEWKMTYVLFIGWAVILLSHFLYASNMTLHFLLWGLTGLLASQVLTKDRRSNFQESPRMGLALSAGFVVVSLGVIASLFISVQRYGAEMAFEKATELNQSGADTTEVIDVMEAAVAFNGFSDTYYRNLSSAYLTQAKALISTVEGEPTTEQTQEIVEYVTASINAIGKATELEPNYASNWSMRGSVYRNVMSFAQGAEDHAAASLERAIELEPNNPVHYTNLGRVYLAIADRATELKTAEDAELATVAAEQEQVLLTSAEESFTKAIELKADYASAHYYLAATYERQGKTEEAVTRLIALRNHNMTDMGVAFQLSLMLIRIEEYDAARTELERIIELVPNHSNAMWYLSAVYEIQGDLDAAITIAETVLALNPGDDMISARLEALRAGKIAQEMPEPVEEGEGETIIEDETL